MNPELSMIPLASGPFQRFLDGAKLNQTLDIGPCILHLAQHPIAGQCLLISTSEGSNAIIIEGEHQASVENLIGLQ